MKPVLLVLLLACAEEPAATPATAPAEATPPVETPAQTPTSASPTTEGPRVPAAAGARMAASHILVSWRGAVGARPNVTRDQAEAKTRAEEALALVKGGKSFAEVAKGWSDDSTGPRGGSLGGFGRGTYVEAFENTVSSLGVGEVSGLVETQFGYHIIRRDPVLEVHVAHLLVTWRGAERAPPGVARSREEAKARVEAAVAQLQAGKPWEEVVRTTSDGPLSNDAGDLGWFGRGQLATPLDEAAFNLDINAVSDVVETARGFHVLRRIE